jgi:hypothetical protein
VNTGIWWGKLRERDPGVDGSGMWGYGLYGAGSGYGHAVGTCEFGNEPSGL